MKEIKLPQGVWYYDQKERLGNPGGFGAVFSGKDDKGKKVAVKKLHSNAKDFAHRELSAANRIQKLSPDNVMPIRDCGQAAGTDDYFLVMPAADQNLQKKIDDDKIISESEAIAILQQIAVGLSTFGNVIHRDLKPHNILLHENVWKIADYGITKFIEESTAPQTLKKCLSPSYASPEQWLEDSVTPAADMYSLGCIAICMLTGQPPFSAGSREELRARHVKEAPPKCDTCTTKLQSLISTMLRKAPDSRPSIGRVLDTLNSLNEKKSNTHVSNGLKALRVADAEESRRAAEQEAVLRSAEAKRHTREKLREEGESILNECINDFEQWINNDDLHVNVHRSAARISFGLGSAQLEFDVSTIQSVSRDNPLPASQWDIVCSALIKITQQEPKPAKRSCSLCFAKKPETQDYRWWEIKFDYSPWIRQDRKHGYCALDDYGSIDEALSISMSRFQATQRLPIDGEDKDEARDRWAALLACASQGRLELQ